MLRTAPPRKPIPGTSLQSSEAIAARLDEMERKIERLRSLYESFFLGVERRPPHVPRQELNRLMLETQQFSIRNAALRFRFQALSQRWVLMTTYWNRTLREIESGTYRRDLQKAYRRIAARGEAMTEDEAVALGIPLARAKAFVAQQNRRTAPDLSPTDTTAAPPTATPPPPALSPAPVPASGSISATTSAIPADEHDLTALCSAYIEAHIRLALPGPPPSPDRILTKVLPHLRRLRAAHPSARLDVTVVSDGGRVVVRAKPVTT